jgi:chemotaxis protein MotB
MPRRRGRKGNGQSGGGNERWLITYSDLITLLMIFFVIMYAMSKVDTTKFMTLSQSLQAALHKPDQIPMNNMGTSGLVVPMNPMDQSDKTQTHPNLTSQEDKQLDNLYSEVKAYIDENHLNGNVSILNEQRGVQITLRDVVLFDTGQAVIKPAARGLLNGLVPFFRKVDNSIVIEGYTDNVPISTSEFPTNWDLSSARADGVVRYLESQVDPTRLSAVGYGEFHPIAPNDSENHRQQNRRVNIVILRKIPAQMSQPSTDSPAGQNSTDGTGNSTN